MPVSPRVISKQRTRIKKLADKWLPVLGLDRPDIKIMLDLNPEDPDEEDWLDVMYVQDRWEYQQATINVNVPAIMEVPDPDLERYFVHECMHILLGALRPKNPGQSYRHLEEHTATTLANQFVRVRKLGRHEGAKQAHGR